jgi:hypothetical protein
MNKKSIVRFVLASFAVMCSILAVGTSSRASSSDVTFTGLVTCGHCLDLSQHKGFTRWSWASYKVSQGDDIVLVTPAKTYNLQGDRKQLSKYLEDKVTVSGNLDAGSIVVTSINKPAQGKETQSGN